MDEVAYESLAGVECEHGTACPVCQKELEKLRKLKEKLEHYNPSLHDLLMQEIEAGR